MQAQPVLREKGQQRREKAASHPNHAAGRAPGGPGIHAEMERYLEKGMDQVRRLLAAI